MPNKYLQQNPHVILTGNVAGEIYQWNGNTVIVTKKLHTRPVDCITIYPEFVLTGGRDAKINVVNKKLASLMIVDVGSKMFNSIHPGVRSLTMDAAKSSLIIGTLGSEIFEMQIDVMAKKAGENRILMQGHYAPCTKWTNEIWGLAPMKEPGKFVTVSDDATLRVWDVEERKQERLVRFDIDEEGKALPKDPTTKELADNVKARSVEISPDGSSMAVGFKDGSLAIVNTSTWKILSKRKDAKSWVSDIKFSPDGSSLAAGSHDTIIYLYKFPEMTKRAICKGHSSFIRHIDWSEDSSTLHSNSGDYELLFWDGNSGKQNTGGATAFRDEKWDTWTCIIGWPVQGIWLPGSKGSDINGCARSNVKHDNYELLATADDFSTVRVFRYPCIQKNSMSVDGRGHSSHVTNVRFSPDDKYLFSTGGNDGCVFQWLVQ